MEDVQSPHDQWLASTHLAFPCVTEASTRITYLSHHPNSMGEGQLLLASSARLHEVLRETWRAKSSLAFEKSAA